MEYLGVIIGIVIVVAFLFLLTVKKMIYICGPNEI